jgi:membrane protein DedA with SNARE-associated domain
VLVLTIAPFLLFASQMETFVAQIVLRPTSRSATFSLVTVLLWADILLPIPSSVVITYAGAKLGWFPAFLASDLGMTLGVITAYGFGRITAPFGVAKLSSEQQKAASAGLQTWGPWAIVISRGIPLVAEIVLIYIAAQRIGFRDFFWPALAANTAISLGYALLGQWAADHEWLAIVLGASGVFPLLLGVIIRQRLARR